MKTVQSLVLDWGKANMTAQRTEDFWAVKPGQTDSNLYKTQNQECILTAYFE